jgi:hypothetical protein
LPNGRHCYDNKALQATGSRILLPNDDVYLDKFLYDGLKILIFLRITKELQFLYEKIWFKW